MEDDASSTRTFTQKKYDSTQQNNSLEQALSDEESGALKQEATVLAKTANESAKENATKKTQWQKKNGKKKKNKRYLWYLFPHLSSLKITLHHFTFHFFLWCIKY